MSTTRFILLLIPLVIFHGDLQQVAAAFSSKAASHEEIIDFTDFTTQDLHVSKPPVVHGEKDVVVLTGKNFSSFIAENKYVMVLFYATWCGWSQKMVPEFEAAATLLKGDQVAFAKVDATRESELAVKYKVSGYPTVFLLAGRVCKPYDSKRTRNEIVSWVRSNIRVLNVTANDDAEPIFVTTFTEERAPLIFQNSLKQLWLFDTKSGSKEVKSAFEEASKALGQELLFVYAEISDDDMGRRLAAHFELTGDTPRIIARSRHGNKYVFNGDITASTIKSFGEDFLDGKLPYASNLIPEQILRLHTPSHASDPTSFPHIA
ncbi:hypothetical protein QUC31_006428 [Theobroma cacao]|uniref:Disulfide isomerase-like protein n=1 Tax=Theobroma cacao TaxID=3641 RepID=A0A061FMU1_THECC|nr:Disulfide isomerase-like protein [Theobroma cacao]